MDLQVSHVTMEAGYVIFKIVLQGNPIEQIKNQVGGRANLNKLIFGSNGKSELAKHVQMFGEQDTLVGYELQHHFHCKSIASLEAYPPPTSFPRLGKTYDPARQRVRSLRRWAG